MKPYFVYILKGEDDSLYTGITVDIANRLAQHNGTKIGGAKYTATRRPWKLVYSEKCESRSMASIREHEIKSMTHAEKKEILNI
jgi:putative endonuclease